MLSTDEAFRLSRFTFADIADSASAIRDDFSRHYITYSPKVFLPLTHLCQDTCSYCTFAQSPSQLDTPYMSMAAIRNVCQQGVEHFCAEALFTLGEAPEKRYDIAAQWLTDNSYASTIDYLVAASRMVIHEFGLLPHVNPGAVADRDLRKLKEVSISQGMMLESIAGRLCEPGGPHFGSPDKTPARRLATLEAAGRVQVPFTTGMLVGIGDTRHERIEGLLAIRDLNARYGHIQEIIIQNFLPKPATGMASEPACEDEEHLWSVAAARLIFENTTHIQAPPNLASSVTDLIRAGVDDLGGISPVTIDYVNPEKPWPHLHTLSRQLLDIGKKLRARAAIYPEFINRPGFVAEHLRSKVAQLVNSSGYLHTSPLDSGAGNFSHEPKTASVPVVVDLTLEEKAEKKSDVRPERSSNLPVIRPGA